MNISTFKKKLLSDINVSVLEQFDRNFERKGFFDQRWPETRQRNTRGSLMLRSGRMRRSLRGHVLPNGIGYSSSVPYFSIHNNGGKIKVTQKMRKFFWFQHKQQSGRITELKSGKISGSTRNVQTATQAEFWRNMAMIRSDSITMPQRQVVGHHRKIDTIVRNVCDRNFKELADSFSDRFKHNLNNT